MTKLPKIDSLKRTIWRQRQIINHAYPQPLTLADLVLSLEYQQTTKSDQFKLYDSSQEHSNRFIIFGTHQNIDMLRNSQIWLADGTFKSAPALFRTSSCHPFTPWGAKSFGKWPLITLLVFSTPK